VSCAACGSWTTYPAPTPAELDTAYGNWYRPSGGRFWGPLERLLRRSRGRLAQRIDALAPSGPVLDVGSGDGALLDAIERTGRRAQGLERVPSSDQRVLTDPIDEVDDGWAAIVMWHSLEHLPEAGLMLNAAAARLAPRGLLLLAAPNPSSIQARLFGPRWLALDLPRHLVHVPAAALLERIEAAGLRVERVSYLRGGQVLFGWLDGIVGRLPGRLDLYDAIRRAPARRRRTGVAKNPFHNDSAAWSCLKQIRQQPIVNSASWISARRS
jgi:hypothetical protein